LLDCCDSLQGRRSIDSGCDCDSFSLDCCDSLLVLDGAAADDVLQQTARSLDCQELLEPSNRSIDYNRSLDVCEQSNRSIDCDTLEENESNKSLEQENRSLDYNLGGSLFCEQQQQQQPIMASLDNHKPARVRLVARTA
jgi:hypothetical protein